MSSIICGDDTLVTLTLLNPDGAPADIAGATTVEVALARLDRSASLIPVQTCSPATVGANWSAGTVVVDLPGSVTAALAVGQGTWEVQVTTAGRRRTYLDVGRVSLLKSVIA